MTWHGGRRPVAGSLAAATVTIALLVGPTAAATRSSPALLGVNTLPVAVEDIYTVRFEHNIRISNPGVLSNDLDLDGDELIALALTGPTHAKEFELDKDGSLKYEPVDGFTGIDTFTYVASDGQATSLPAIVTLVVGPKSTPKPTPSPTPTPVPTAAPTATPTAAATATPTAIATPTPVATAAPQPTPAPTVTPTPAPPRTPDPTDRPGPTPTDDVAGPTPVPGAAGPVAPAPSAAPTNRAVLGAPSDPDASDASGVGAAGPVGRGGPDDPAAGTPGSDPDPALPPIQVGAPDQVIAVDLVAPNLDGGIDLAVEWAVPTMALTVPGLLIVLAVLAQSLGALAWVPIVRRWRGGAETDPDPRRIRRGSLLS